ncbi:MAG: hypothetical protein ACO3DK_08735 [Bacteroidia bacterium]
MFLKKYGSLLVLALNNLNPISAFDLGLRQAPGTYWLQLKTAEGIFARPICLQ